LKRKSEIMLKRTLIAAATAAALAGTAIAAAAPAAAASAGYMEMHGPGQWKGSGQWNGGQKYSGHRKSCEPIVRWKMVGHHYRKHWQPVVVGWDCDFGRSHHRGQYN
jgi:opacity protein-like surface antigen